MNILEYVGFLQPVMEKRELLKDLDQIHMEYVDTLLPVLDEVEEAFNQLVPKSNFYKKFDMRVKRSISSSDQSLALVFQSIRNTKNVIEVTKKEVKDKLGIQFTNKGLTFSKANIIKMVDALAFYTKYSRKFLLVLVANEAATLGNSTKETWSPAEREYVENSLHQFISLMPTMCKSIAELKQAFNNASDAVVEAETYNLSNRSISLDKLDPLLLENFSPRSSPFVSFGKWRAEVKHKRYLLAKEELYGLQLRLEELRSLKAQEPTNPVIQKQIQAYEKRISDYEYDISKIEERSGL